MNEPLHLDLVAERVLLAMEAAHSLQVVAVWENGSVTTHPFSFWGRRLPGRRKDYPIATFVATHRLPSVEDIMEQLAQELMQRGWTAAS
ncbi:MAG: hypothetical protein U5Q44_15670 [Dehalococcoidia bacterium]|nr:hypothetical protein [Dehalococcoidia bacterium]